MDRYEQYNGPVSTDKVYMKYSTILPYAIAANLLFKTKTTGRKTKTTEQEID